MRYALDAEGLGETFEESCNGFVEAVHLSFVGVELKILHFFHEIHVVVFDLLGHFWVLLIFLILVGQVEGIIKLLKGLVKVPEVLVFFFGTFLVVLHLVVIKIIAS